MRRVLVTAGNRGLGLEFVRQLLAAGDTVVATARRPHEADELRGLVAHAGERAALVALDVADPASVEACGDAVRARFGALDLLVNNAGVLSAAGSETDPASGGPLAALRADALTRVLRVNTLGALLVTQGCAPLFRTGAVVANLSSGLGSLARNPLRNYGYAISKAGLNMVTRQLAAELAGVVVVSLDPGWVRTDLGGQGANVAVDESVTALLGVVSGLGPQDSGAFLNRHGACVPW